MRCCVSGEIGTPPASRKGFLLVRPPRGFALPCSRRRHLSHATFRVLEMSAPRYTSQPRAMPIQPDPELPEVRDIEFGRRAESPADIPFRGWRQVIARTWREVSSDRVSLVAAGCAFWATLALFPAISTLISLYGIAFDPLTVEPQLQVVRGFLPPAAFALIADRVHTLVLHPTTSLGLTALLTAAITLWSAATGVKSLISALNMAYEEREKRSLLQFQLVGLAMTACAIIGAGLGLVLLVFLPVAIEFVGLSAYTKTLVKVGSLVLLVLFVAMALALLYRYGPCRRAARWRWVTPGSLLATILWLLASVLFSFYVGHVASYDATYGPLGAVAGVMVWFWVSVYVVLLGAELNAELELQTSSDTTGGPPKPIGARGAYVADHVAGD